MNSSINPSPILHWLTNLAPPVYVRVTTGGKLEAKAEEAIFVGVDQESRAYCIW
jgi:hypothetical protein